MTHKNLIALTNAQIEATGYHRGHSIVLNLPFSHVGGAVMGIICNECGQQGRMMDVFNPEETLRLVSEEKATTWDRCPPCTPWNFPIPTWAYDISSLKLPIVSSQPCPLGADLGLSRRSSA